MQYPLPIIGICQLLLCVIHSGGYFVGNRACVKFFLVQMQKIRQTHVDSVSRIVWSDSKNVISYCFQQGTVFTDSTDIDVFYQLGYLVKSKLKIHINFFIHIYSAGNTFIMNRLNILRYSDSVFKLVHGVKGYSDFLKK